jgi:uncharacterized protein DUF6454
VNPQFSSGLRRLVLAAAALTTALGPGEGATQPKPAMAEAIAGITRTSVWTLERTVPMAFATHHPQGLVKIGDRLFISSVEIKVPTRRSNNRADGFDRDTGEGVGHLFEATMTGKLVADRIVGEGTMYHPGGIDFDGTHIWMTLAEYRPNSRSIVYRVDPATGTATEVFRFADHLGAIVRDPEENVLHAVSWGSRWFYRFALDSRGRAMNAGAPPATRRTANSSHYVDYQDCKHAGRQRMVCSGIADVPRGAGERPLTLGGLDLVDLATGRPVHQVPVGLLTSSGVSMTRNPSFFEPAASGLRAYFLPEDDASTLYVYAIAPGR